ncbi:glucose oxidase-1 [Coleophoma cylindrospora]|uniref:Glucose oxidase-1 n=1 Tax=Coleophoma cylindrospora TaxID=1849047 RepID=A0A3D8Q9U0_9HELO|nr:glucose oxidase-1 [Coleophoma cylindrospora]
MLRLLPTLVLASMATAQTTAHQNSQSVAYDYVIVGAGTSGLVIANRLSELNLTIAVIEAGDSVLNNVNVSSPNGYGLAFDTAIDWAYQTTNQTYGGQVQQTLRAGKAIGGTSTINGMAYTRAEDIQIDAWETLGNQGWNWETLLPYYKKSQTLQIPSDDQTAAGATYNATFNGFGGPLKIGWKSDMDTSNVHTILNDTYAALGVQWNQDVNGGRMVGYNRYPSEIDVTLNVREDAGRAYYYPIANRTNLHLYSNTVAQKLRWKADALSPTADGVEVLAENSTTPYVISATREVILSAGALGSPLLLELSGVGNPTILNRYNISTVVDLPTVGENLQDQTNTGLIWNTAGNKSYTASGGYVAYPTAADIFGSRVANVSADILASLPAYAEKVATASGNITKAKDLLSFFTMQHNLIFSGEHAVPVAEVLLTPSGNVVDTEYWALLPFARGSIHISSATAGAPATINPNYYMLGWDVTSQFETANFIRRIMATAPFSSLVADETKPGLDVVPANSTQEEWFKWNAGAYRSNFHPVATAAMMPREIGGVVDAKLKVYGTENVRVVDASVLPLQVCGHLVSTLYAVAERAADLIKNDL